MRGKFTGVFAPICTPFTLNEDVDDPALRHNLTLYATSGIRGYLALGSNQHQACRAAVARYPAGVGNTLVADEPPQRGTSPSNPDTPATRLSVSYRVVANRMASFGLPVSPAFARSTSSAAAVFDSAEVVLPVPIALRRLPPG